MKKSYTLQSTNLLNTKKLFSENQSKNNEEDNLLPGKHIIQNLINYSKSLNIVKSKSIGTFGLNSN